MKCTNLIIAPYFEDVAAQDFCADLASSLGASDRVLIVDDGSLGLPFDEQWLSENGVKGQVLRLVRNVGHQQAIHAGLSYAVNNIEFAHVIILDSDGEDKPSDIQRLLGELEGGGDVAVATRRSRVESVKFKAFYQVYRFLFRALVGHVIGFGNFMAMTFKSAKRLSLSPESQLHLAASVINSRLDLKKVSLDRGERYRGSSRMNLVSLTLHGLRSVMVFADQVLVRITLFSVAFGALVIAAMLAMTSMKLIGAAIPGWYSTGGGILILMLTQAAFMALMMLLMSGKLLSKAVLDPQEYQKMIAKIDVV